MSSPANPAEVPAHARDLAFRRLLVVSTALAFGGMLGTLGAVEKRAGGLVFRFHWAAPALFAAGCGLAVIFWRVVYRFEKGSDDLKKSRLKQVAAALFFIAFTAFFYPLRLVDPERRLDVLFGIVSALIVLSGFGWLLYYTIQRVEQSSREEESRHHDPE